MGDLALQLLAGGSSAGTIAARRVAAEAKRRSGTDPAKSAAPLDNSGGDALGTDALAARQRAAQRMADGMSSSFGTSTRGLEGKPGAGVKGPPRAGDDEPIISTMTGREAEMAALPSRNAFTGDAEYAPNTERPDPRAIRVAARNATRQRGLLDP